MIITSSDNKKIKDLKKLLQRKYREEEGLFLVEGEHLVMEAYKSGYLVEVIIDENEIMDLDIAKTYVTDNVMNVLSSLTTSPKVIGVCRKIESKGDIGTKIVMLDSIQDPGNLGTIIRSAVAFNIDTVVLGKGSVDIYNPKVLRATQGLIFHINIIEEDLYEMVTKLKQDKFIVIGTRMMGGKELRTATKMDKFVLIMGNEGHGMSRDLEALCDDFIYINMNNVCESLNVSIACSIILYQLDK